MKDKYAIYTTRTWPYVWDNLLFCYFELIRWEGHNFQYVTLSWSLCCSELWSELWLFTYYEDCIWIWSMILWAPKLWTLIFWWTRLIFGLWYNYFYEKNIWQKLLLIAVDISLSIPWSELQLAGVLLVWHVWPTCLDLLLPS